MIAPDLVMQGLGSNLVGSTGVFNLSLAYIWCADIRIFVNQSKMAVHSRTQSDVSGNSTIRSLFVQKVFRYPHAAVFCDGKRHKHIPGGRTSGPATRRNSG